MTELYRTVVVDHEYKQLGTVVKNYCHMLDSIIAEYQACLSNLTAGAVESGETQKALLEFLSYVYKLKGKLVEIGDKFYGCCNDFINEIIGGGQYLYDNRYSDTAIRDFTQYRYNELVKGIDCNHESSNPLIRLLDHLDDKVVLCQDLVQNKMRGSAS